MIYIIPIPGEHEAAPNDAQVPRRRVLRRLTDQPSDPDRLPPQLPALLRAARLSHHLRPGRHEEDPGGGGGVPGRQAPGEKGNLVWIDIRYIFI